MRAHHRLEQSLGSRSNCFTRSGDGGDGPGQEGRRRRPTPRCASKLEASFTIAAIEVDGIRQGLEGVEAEAEGKDPVPVFGRPQLFENRPHMPGADEQTQVEDDADGSSRYRTNAPLKRIRPSPTKKSIDAAAGIRTA